MNAAWPARPKWKNIGLQLQIDIGTLDAINMNNHYDVDGCFTDMLVTWLKMTYKPTLETLANALTSPSVGYEDVAEEILSLK